MTGFSSNDWKVARNCPGSQLERDRSGLDCFGKFIATLKEHAEIITNYFTHRPNSGWCEGLNNKIKCGIAEATIEWIDGKREKK